MILSFAPGSRRPSPSPIAGSGTAVESQNMPWVSSLSMSESNRMSRIKIRKDENGSIEGLPLQLMIMGIIASLGTAVIVGWISSIQTPIYIGKVEITPQEILVHDSDENGIFDADLKELTIRITDTSGNPIGDAQVLIEGSALSNDHHRLFGTTDADGMLSFKSVSVKVIGDHVSSLKMSVSGQGIASEYWTEVMVLPE